MDDELKKQKQLLRNEFRRKRILKLHKEKTDAQIGNTQGNARQLVEQRIAANLFALLVSYGKQHYASSNAPIKKDKQSPMRIMLYHPLPAEVDVLQTIVWAKHSQYLAVPKCIFPQQTLQKNRIQNTDGPLWQQYYHCCFRVDQHRREQPAMATKKHVDENGKNLTEPTEGNNFSKANDFPTMQFYLPRITSLNQASMVATPALLDNLQKNSKLGIMEPLPSLAEVSASAIAVVAAPGLAYDENGVRLGFGGGYYDRFFADGDKTTPQLKVGIFRSWQRASNRLPKEDNDVALDIVVHEKGFEYFGKGLEYFS